MSECHDGECPDADKCSKKTKAYCPCRRIKKEVRCDILRSCDSIINCDDACKMQKSQKEKVRLAGHMLNFDFTLSLNNFLFTYF